MCQPFYCLCKRHVIVKKKKSKQTLRFRLLLSMPGSSCSVQFFTVRLLEDVPSDTTSYRCDELITAGIGRRPSPVCPTEHFDSIFFPKSLEMLVDSVFFWASKGAICNMSSSSQSLLWSMLQLMVMMKIYWRFLVHLRELVSPQETFNICAWHPRLLFSVLISVDLYFCDTLV